jgi:uncharacterized glyoxalase superfamily protein PhnB
MIESMKYVMLFVKDCDEALDFYTSKLGFVKITHFSPVPGWRFSSFAPKGQGTEIILHLPNSVMHGEAEAKRQVELIGKTPALMFKVDNCEKTCDELRSKGVILIMEPTKTLFGIQARIVDLYGNPLWLIEHPE